MTQWRIRPRPRPRESLSSWLIRIAVAKGTRHHSLIEELAPGTQFWTRDGDLVAPPALLYSLAEKVGIPRERAAQTALRSFEGVLDERISGDSQSFMVVPLGVRHRIRKAHGQHFCPRCLGEPDPYLPLVWRLRLFPTCTKHGVVLLDGCPSCDTPYQPHRSGFRRCTNCDFDFTTATCAAADARVLTLQFHNQQILDGRAVQWPHLSGLHPLAYFGLQFALFRAIIARSWGKRVRRGLEPYLGSLELHSRGEALTTRSITVHSAHQAMRGVELLLRGFPFMLAGICGEARAWSSWIVPEERGANIPFILRDALDRHLRPGPAP